MPGLAFVGDRASAAAGRARALGATIVGSDAEAEGLAAPVRLELLGERLHARLAEWPRSAAFRVDFDPARLAEATRSPLVRAAGTPPGVLLDATAGFGGDAMTFAAAGWTVIALERNPWVHWLLDEGLAAARADPRLAGTASRVSLVHLEATVALDSIARGESVPGTSHLGPLDVVLLDPMFPLEERRKRALPPKAAQLLRAIVGEDRDASGSLELARRIAGRRVVVKRPPWADPLLPTPEFTIETKLLRLDAYRPTA